jgi:hypothetical protein
MAAWLAAAIGCVHVPHEDPLQQLKPEPPKKPTSLLGIARQTVAAVDGWPDRGTMYDIERHDGGWTVHVTRVIGLDPDGNPQSPPDGHREIEIDDNRRVTSYRRVP